MYYNNLLFLSVKNILFKNILEASNQFQEEDCEGKLCFIFSSNC